MADMGKLRLGWPRGNWGAIGTAEGQGLSHQPLEAAAGLFH
ncbi:unknown protein [Waddlia chondrophila 2032/99]|uniref:Uncharacterized protein n=1 Tax=Waddlia chondrophila 2032/99 TaxID=765953 RepID=F8LAD2_9BACT|nr:unknown protein [Waddlia chondrophila 2032/99]